VRELVGKSRHSIEALVTPMGDNNAGMKRFQSTTQAERTRTTVVVVLTFRIPLSFPLPSERWARLAEKKMYIEKVQGWCTWTYVMRPEEEAMV